MHVRPDISPRVKAVPRDSSFGRDIPTGQPLEMGEAPDTFPPLATLALPFYRERVNTRSARPEPLDSSPLLRQIYPIRVGGPIGASNGAHAFPTRPAQS